MREDGAGGRVREDGAGGWVGEDGCERIGRRGMGYNSGMARNEAPPGAEKWVPAHPGGLDELKQAAAQCEGCQLHEDATQTVFGRGAPDARVVFVGEQPGDVEDQQGLPFVGPAGRVLREAVEEAGIEVPWVYITNAVAHVTSCLRLTYVN